MSSARIGVVLATLAALIVLALPGRADAAAGDAMVISAPKGVSVKPTAAASGGKKSIALPALKSAFPNNRQAALLFDGGFTLKANKKTVQVSEVQLYLLGTKILITARLGKVRHNLFVADTGGISVVNEVTGSVLIGPLIYKIPTGTRKYLGKKFKLKKGKGLKAGRAGVLRVSVVGVPPTVDPPKLPDPPPPPAPNATITSGTAGYTGSPSAQWEFESNQPNSTFECSLDGGPAEECTSPYSLSSLDDGAHLFVVRATNENGTGNSDNRSFTVDTVSPVVTIEPGLDGSTVLESPHEIPFEADEPANYTCSLDGGPSSSCATPYEATLSEGSHSFSVTATDLAGNTGTSSVSFTTHLTATLCGTISTDTTLSPSSAYTYRVTCHLTIADGATLTIASGSVLKFNDGVQLIVDGGLDVNGTLANPVSFTTIRDDTINGDTGGNGSATTPSPGNWSGVVSVTNHDSSVDIDHADIRYAGTGVHSSKLGDDDAELSITNSNFESISGDAVDYLVASATTDSIPAPTIQGNDFDAIAGVPVDIRSPRIDQTLLGGNDSGTAEGGMNLKGTLIGDGSLDYGSLVPVINGLTVAAGATLDVDPGQIYKAQPGTGLTVNGSLVSAGADGNNAVFTSLYDDTVGGEIQSGPVIAPARGNWTGIASGSGVASTIDIDETTIRYAQTGIGSVKAGTDDAPFSVTNSTIDETLLGGISYSAANAVGADIPAPEISGNLVTDSNGAAIFVQSPRIDQTLLGGNSGSGVNGELQLVGTLIGDGGITNNGFIVQNRGVTVAAGAELAVGAGETWVAFPQRALTVLGTLTVDGDAGDPAVFTSQSDYENAGSAAGDWDGIVVDGGSATMDDFITRYAGTCIAAKNSASMTMTDGDVHHCTTGIWATQASTMSYRGSITSCTNGANKDGGSSVDATDTWWGDASGPSPEGTGTSAINGVLYDPWLTAAP